MGKVRTACRFFFFYVIYPLVTQLVRLFASKLGSRLMAEIEPLLRADALRFIFLVLGRTTVWSCLPHFLICALSVCLSVCLRLFSSKMESRVKVWIGKEYR